MKKTAISEENLNMDWLLAHPDDTQVKNQLMVTPDVQAYTNMLWPFSDDYISPVPHVFLIQVGVLKQLEVAKTWLVRDGLLPMVWFFKRFPNPGSLTSKLLFHSALKNYIPKSWEKNVGFYEYVSTHPYKNGKARTKALFLSLCSENYVSQSQLPELFESIKAIPQMEELKQMEWFGFVPARSGHHDRETSHTVEFFNHLYSLSGGPIRSLSFSRFKAIEDFTSFCIVDGNAFLMMADSAPIHYALSRGAYLLSPTSPHFKADTYVPLSPCHGLNVQTDVSLDSSIFNKINKSYQDLTDYHQKYLSALQSPAYTSLPWPRWFADWMHETAPTTSFGSAPEIRKPKRRN